MKVSMKKVLMLLLSLLLVFSLLAACSDKDKPGEESRVSDKDSISGDDKVDAYDFDGRTFRYVAWWEMGPPDDAVPEDNKNLQRILEMRENNHCDIEFINIPMEQYNETFTSTTLSGDPMGDIVEMHYMWFFPGLVSKGFFTPLDDLGVFDFDAPKWNKTLQKYSTYEGKIYGMTPGEMAPYAGVFWNKTLFERDGLPDLYELQDNYEWTWDKMREIAIKATRDTTGDGDTDQWGLDGGFQGSVVVSNKASIVGIKDDKPFFGLTEPNAIEALQYFQDLKLNDQVFVTAPGDAAWDYGLIQFAAGKTAMYVGSYWMNDRIKPNMTDEYGFVFFPMGPKATEYTSEFSGFNFAIMSSAVEEPAEVAKFWDIYTEPYPGED